MEDPNYQPLLGNTLNPLGIGSSFGATEQTLSSPIALTSQGVDIQAIPLTSQSSDTSVLNTAIVDPLLGISDSQSGIVSPLLANDSLLAAPVVVSPEAANFAFSSQDTSWLGTPQITQLDSLGEVLVVPGTSAETVSIAVQWTFRDAKYNNEIGVFVVDQSGKVGGFAPGEQGFAQAALQSSTRQTLFNSGNEAGNWRELTFAGGSYLAFYLIQNDTSTNWLAKNASNTIGQQSLALFSLQGANPDKFDHAQSTDLGNGIWRINWEDLTGGGDQDFNDVVFNVGQPGILLPGEEGQKVPLTVDFVSEEATYQNEMGYFLVDTSDGKIGDLLPGDEGYTDAVLASDRHQVMMTAGETVPTQTVNLPSTKYLGWYLVANGTTDDIIQARQNNAKTAPHIFFSYSAANKDGLSHLHAQADSHTWAWEDVFGGGDRDFNDLVFRFNLGDPIGEPTVLPNLSISDLTVTEGDTGTQDANFTVRLSQASSQTVTAQFTTEDDTAKSSEDYEAQTGIVSFAPGEVEKTISVKVSGDRLKESTESFKVNLANANNALITQGVGIGTILDNDNLTPLLPSLSIGDVTVTEGDEGTQKTNFAVRLSQASEQTVTAEFVTEDDTAKSSEDYEAQTGMITFSPGEVEKMIAVNIKGDRLQESTESFKVNLANANNALITQGVGIGTILDNDNDVNEAPFFISQPILTAEVGTAYQYEIKAQDPDNNDILTISAIQNPLNWTKTDISNGVALLSQIPTINDIGQHIFEWKVEDADGLIATQNYTLAVSALLKEANNFSPSLQKAITVPTTPTILQFKIEGLSFDQTDINSIKDAFEVELVDAQGNSLVHTIGSDKTAFFNITEGLTANLAPGVTYDANTGIIRVNLVGVQPNATGNLVLRLVNNDQDTATQIRITDITLENAPAGTTAPVATPAISALQSVANPPNLTNLVDVSGSMEVQYQRTTLNEDTNLVYADFNLKNIGSYGVNTNLLVAIKNISDPTVQVRDTDGVTLEGLPYYDFTDLLVNGKLDFNQVTNSRSLVFFNPNQVQFTYDVVVLAVVNRNPIIQTQPELEIIGGQAYQYDVNAIDSDLDNLSYWLLVAPQGMTIDAVTGLINWQTATANIGNQVVKVEVTDGRGGFAQQNYTLSVIDTPTNRPPIFTSNPVVNGNVNTEYRYDANATDADNDSLTYSLIANPELMTIDPLSGLLIWTPKSSQLGKHQVQIQVADGKGGTALQVYDIVVDSALNNQAPIFVSSPITQFNLPSSSNPLNGTVNPEKIDLSLGLNEVFGGTVTLTLPEDKTTGSADIVFIVDESGSMSGLHAWLRDMVDDLDNGLIAKGVGNNRYGLVGFGGGSVVGRVFDFGSGNTFGNVNEFINISQALQISGGTEDGYNGINTAFTNLTFRPDAALNLILVTDEDRDIVSPELNFGNILLNIENQNALLNAVIRGSFDNATHTEVALGIDANGNSYLADKNGGYLISSIGNVTGSENTKADYIDLALATGGAAWDLTQLAQGGLTAQSFTKAFIDIKTQEILTQLPITVIASDAQISFKNLTGTLSGLSAGETASFDIEIIGDAIARSFDLLFVRPETGTILGSIPVTINNDYFYLAQAIDPDNDLLTYSIIESPTGATINSQTGKIHWKPNQSGDYTFKIAVDDGRGGYSIQEYIVKVQLGTANTAPSIASLAPINAFVDRPYNYLVTASDTEGDTLSFYLQEAPEGLSIDINSGKITWTPNNLQIGEHLVKVRVLDRRGAEAIQSFLINVTPDLANRSPVIQSTPLLEIKEGELYSYQINATDADADSLTFDLPIKPEGMSIDSTTGLIVWNPKSNQYGNQNVIVRVRDGHQGTTLQTFTINVISLNKAPLFTSLVPDNAQAQSGKTFQFQATAIDADNDTLTYSFANNTPNGITIDSTTGLVTWTPDDTQLGANQFTVKVADGKGGQAFQTVTLTVNAADNNQSPIFTSTPRTTTRIGSSYFYQVEATDPNGDALTYSLVNAPTGMTLEKGLISWQSTAAQAGQQTVTIQASDGTLTTEQTYQITVSHQASNRAPIITSAPNLTTNIEQIYTYNLTGQDPDGDLVFWSLDQPPSGMVLDIQTGVLRWQPQSNQLGQQEVIVRLLDSYGDYSTQTFTLQVNGANSPANILSNPLTRAAVNQAYTYTVVAVDPENSPLTYSLGRRPNGMTIDAMGKVQWTPTQVGSYDIDVSVTDNQGATTTQTYRLEAGSTAINRAPNITSTPSFVANVGSVYQYQIEASDPDGQTLLYQLLQSPQGMTIDAASGLLSWTTPVNGNYQVVVAVFDSEGLGVTQGYTLTAKTNSLPVIRSTPKLEAVPNQLYRYDLQAVDPDGDSLSYSLDATSQALGMILDAQGRLTWTPNNSQLGDHAVTLTVTDGAGGTTQQSFTLKVTADTTGPQVRINRSLSLINQGETVSFQVVATDNVGIANLQLLINDTPVVIDSNGVASFTATTTGVITAKAVALDGAGNRGEATTTVNVLDPTDTEAPTVSLDLSGIVNGEITAPVEIKGSVNDTNLAYYALEVAPADGSQPFKEMFRGTSTVNNGVLGVLDPTLLPNDTYKVRLVAYDVNGAGNGVSELLDVKGDLKLGNFQLSFTDLEIPVSGIPIALTRTYDTLTSNSQDDFGYGWRMEFRNASVRTSLPKDELYEELGFRSVGFKEGDSVYITLPGGKRERFTFKLESMKVMGIPLAALMGNRALYIPTFVADKDSTSTLSVNTAGIALIKGTDGQVVPSSGGSAFAHYNTQDWGNYYQLTTKEGIVYNIDATTGDINTITNRNGDVLNFSDGGIVSSNGQQVTFERDAKGRIVTAIDPMGNRIKYQYDANGDLVKVTDRENNTTTFEYNGQQAHYLDKIIDPLGKTGVRNEYDENGRLTKVFNALGNSVQLEYNPDNSLYTTKDALGNATTYEYDVRGNIITEVDAKGGITRRTYDEDNNLLSETNPEGETSSSTYDSSGNKLTETDALGNVTRYTYNAKGDLLSTTDALGNTVTNTYDSNGNPTAISGLANGPINLTYGAGGLLTTLTTAEGTTTYEYDGAGNVTKEVDPLGHETIYTYNSNGNRLTETRKLTTSAGVKTLVTTTEYNAKGDVIKVTDALGNVTQMAYDANGKKTQEIDALGRVTKYVYSDGGQLLETIYADATPNNDSDNPRTRKEYDAANRVVAEIDELGRRTEFQYDSLGRLTFTLFPDLTPNDASDNARTESRYDDAGRVIAEVDERGNITRYEYDALGRRTKTILPDGTANNDSDNPQLVVTYDALGRQLTQVDPLGRTTQYLYDGLGRSIGQIFADQTDISTTYDLAGRVVGKTDQMGNKTQYEYNAVGQLTAVIDALNQRTEYQYNELGNLISQKDALGNTTRYEYDGLGRRIGTDLPLGQEATMTYDAVGNLLTTTDFNGETIHFEYDERNRLLSRIFPDNSRVAYTYTLTGQRATETSSLGTITYSYDVRDNLLSRVDADGVKIEYSYDAANNRTAVKVPSGQTSYSFDEQNRLKTVTDPQAGVTTYTYDLAGNLIKTTLANGTTETREYDLLNRLLYLQNSNSNGVINSFRYTLDKVGNRLAIVEQDGRQSNYQYDALYRLLQEEIIDGTTRTIGYTYDVVSNRLTLNDSLEGNTSYEYDGNDRLLKEVTNGVTTTYTYDNNGNTLTKTVGTAKTTYEWNVENRLVGADTDGDGVNDVTNEYDGDGVRIRQTVAGEETRFLVDKNRDYAQVLEEYTPSKIIKASYIYGHDLISQLRDTERSFYHVDGLGSTRALTDINGLLTDAYAYEAFGEIIKQLGNTQNSYLFAGEQRDPNLGLDYLRARYLDVNSGRFYGRDPFKGFYKNPITLNKYVYANTNPVNIIDPSGLMSLGEINVTLNIQSTLNVGFRFITALERVQTFVSIYESVIVIFGLATNPGSVASISTYLANPEFAKFLTPDFFDNALISLRRNAGRIMLAVAKEHGLVIPKILRKESSAFYFYLPSPPVAIKPPINLPTGLKIGSPKRPVRIFSNSKGSRLFGVGIGGGNSNLQLFRMDYGPYNHVDGSTVWQDPPFHYHV
jgi:RHS repeat-associated protein